MLGPFGIAGELGYWIRANHEGRGHITRACRALIDIGFEELGLHRIEIRAGLENARSRAVPERLGFTYEGIEREGSRGSRGCMTSRSIACSTASGASRPSRSIGSGGTR